MATFRFRRFRGSSAAPPEGESITRRSRTSWGDRPGCLAGFFSVFLLAGLAFFSFFAIPAWKVIQARSWIEVPCTIVSSGVGSHSDSDGTTYSIDVVYTYTVQGVEYRSERYEFLGGSSSGYEGKAEVVAGYPPGSRATCWVDPEDPSEAVLYRGFTWFYLIALFPLIFVAIGAGGMVFALRKGRASGRRAAAPAWLPEAPGEAAAAAAETPDLAPGFSFTPEGGLPAGATGPLVLEARHGPWLKFFGIVAIAAFWNGITGIFVWQAVQGWQSGAGDGCLTVFLVPFVLVGLVLLLGVPYQLLALFNPRLRLTVSDSSLPVGGTAEVSWSFSGSAGRIRRLKIELVGREAATYRRGTDTRTDTEEFARLPVADTTQRPEIAAGSAVVTVPEDTMHSFEASNNKIRWSLEAAGEIARWPDVGESFTIVVEPRAAAGRDGW
jgi:hypothetical protein